jgi:hypothetical protein
MPKGRPPLTPEIAQDRIDAYRTTYGVTELNAEGFPVFPAGRRESRQHRDWVLLFKAWSRVRAREATRHAVSPANAACPVCQRPPAADHARCVEVLVTVRAGGPAVLDRLRDYLAAGRIRNRRRPPSR